MALGLIIAYIWSIGLRDCLLTSRLVVSFGPEAELNSLARWVITHYGVEALYLWKGLTLFAFTLAVTLLRRRSKSLSEGVTTLGAGIYTLLAIWWDYALW